jgi:hypothetical protein
MSLYEQRFDTDWDDLDRDEAMERAFALGVAASLGDRNVEEFQAVKAAMDTNYDTSIVELAYEEGKQKATKRQRKSEASNDDADVFEFVVSAEIEGTEPPDVDDEEADRATDLPSAVSKRTEATERPDPDPEQTEFPDFLE